MSNKKKFSISDWLNERLRLDKLPFFRTPDYMYNAATWLGALVAAAFFWQAITGLILLMYYDAGNAYNSTISIINDVPYGSVLLFSHLYGAFAMILLVYTHMFYNYFRGAYKRPRELIWILGIILLLLTLGTAFYGYSAIGDVLAVSALDVGSGILSGIGLGSLVPVAFGDYAAGNFSRIIGLHVALAALIFLFFALHFFLAEQQGMMPPRSVRPKAPAIYAEEEEKNFNPWWPRNFVYMLSLIFMTWGWILIISNSLAYLSHYPVYLDPFLNPRPAPSPTSPAAATITAYPPWFFLFFFKMADFISSFPALVAVGAIPLIWLLITPFIDRSDELHPLKRKVFTGVGILMITYMIQLTIWGAIAPAKPATPEEITLVFLPPAIIVAVALPFIKPKEDIRAQNRGLGGNMQFTYLAMASIFLLSAVLMFPSPTLLGIVTSLVLLTGIAAYSDKVFPTMKAAGTSAEKATTINVSLERKKKLAEVIIAILFAMSVIIAFNMWTVPPKGFYSNLFGIDLGLIFLMLGTAISLYHYVVYKK
ncbi:MAG: cytochrome bc complex cytochrome b subunit [Sulfolobaceae archaeon]|nr:cytochrome bc complex cytochrome b subunit [Sulfolobaceae archaeon]